MLVIDNIYKSFRKKVVFQGFSLTLKRDEKVGLIGANGSGKSTLFNLIAGLLDPDQGTITVNEFTRDYPEYRSLIGLVLEQPYYIPEVKVKEMFKLMAPFYKMNNSIFNKRYAELSELLELEEYDEYKIDDLSSGYKSRVSLAMALFNDPPYLLLDEPFTAIEEKMQDRLTGYLKGQKKGILITLHDNERINLLCDRIETI